MTYTEIVTLVLCGGVFPLLLMAIVLVIGGRFQSKPIVQRKRKASRQALIVELRAMRDENRALAQENKLLMAENYRLRQKRL